MCDMITVRLTVSKKLTNGQKTYKQTREPLSKGDSRTGLTAFHIQLHLDEIKYA